MPTRTTPRRAAAQTRGPGRFGRPTSTQRPAAKRGKKSGGTLASLMSAVPMAKAQRKGKGKKAGPSGKAGPAAGLIVAGAGALLGRRQMKRRRAEDPASGPTTAL